MASAKEIQNRIKSVKDTRKITNAMYMISSSKMKRAKKVLAGHRTLFLRPPLRHCQGPAPCAGHEAPVF